MRRVLAAGAAGLIRYGEAMRAITVVPGQQGSVALMDVPEPPPGDGPVLVQAQAIGICGTDLEIINGEYGWAPPGQERLIIGHESQHLGNYPQAFTHLASIDAVTQLIELETTGPAPGPGGAADQVSQESPG
jgi:hypothetical protein